MSSRPSRGAARLAAILDALPDALLLVNCNGTVVNANHIALETFEVPGTGLVGRGLLDLLPSFDSRRIPGSMRLPDDETNGGRTKPTRMIARRTDGTPFPVEVTSANLADGRTPYADAHAAYTGDELLMIVVRDLTGTLDTEAELARQQRQTEMILRAAAEGVVGVDTAGKVVLVNPSAAQILGYRASDLGGRELHPLIHHSRADGTPFPYEESPIADTLRSGRKHRVRGQVLWAKDGRAVPVDLTTAPVRDGDQLVGAVMTFTDRRPYDALAARHAQLLAVLGGSLRGPLEQLRGELGTLADDPAGQLWPEANQILHHLAAGYGRMAKLVDNVLAHQRLESGETRLVREKSALDEVVAAGVEGAVELIGPGRAQFAVHAPKIEAEVDADWFAQALAHLIADVAGVDATGNAPSGGTASGDSTIVVAAAKRDTVVRIEVRGPYAGGDPVHQPIVRGIVRQHGGVLQTHDVPGTAGGKAYVLEVPLSSADGPVTASAERPGSGPASIGSGTTIMPMPAPRAAAEGPGTASGSAPGSAGSAAGSAAAEQGGGRRGKRAAEAVTGQAAEAERSAGGELAERSEPTGRRRAPARPDAERTGAEERDARAAGDASGPPPSGAGLVPPQPGGRRARREQVEPRQPEPQPPRAAFALPPAAADRAPESGGPAEPVAVAAPTGRRARRSAVETAAPERTIPGQADAEPDVPRTAFALPPAEADRRPEPEAPKAPGAADGSRAAEPMVPAQPGPAPYDSASAAPGAAPAPAEPAASPTGRRRARRPLAEEPGAAPQQGGGPAATARPISVRTLGQGAPFAPPGDATPPGGTSVGSGRRRKLGNPAEGEREAQPAARPHPPVAPEGRTFAIGAPDEGAEGPEPLDGPNGAVEIVNTVAAVRPPVDDELPPEPLDNPRRLLVWPAPDASTEQALTERGYRPVIVHSRDEVDAQMAAYPAALFVDPLTGPITRTALQSLRQAAVAAEVPVLVTAGLGQATREAAYGADPAVLLKALAPRDSEMHPPRVLLMEEHEPIANALTATLERRGVQVACAATDSEAVTLAEQIRPNLVVMDLLQVRRRRAGIIDWLRGNGLLSRTPLVVYTSAGIDPAQLPRLASGETVLFLAERSTSTEVQGRIVDLLGKIGTSPG